MRIILTDSGLGGLSVCADILHSVKLVPNLPFNQLDIKYINAIPKTHLGYNAMESRTEQIKTFNHFLTNVSNKYKPDAIYIVCNSLSAIYSKTEFSKTTTNIVRGIIQIGVDLLVKTFNKNTKSGIIILGADTTIEEDCYPKRLVEAGIPADNIVSQACTNLANTISNDISGVLSYDLINKYLTLAIKKLPDNFDYLIVYLGCTHYGYRKNLFELFLMGKKINHKIINPNYHFFDYILDPSISELNAVEGVEPKVEFITHYPIPEQEVNTLSIYLAGISRETATALQNYSIVEDLF